MNRISHEQIIIIQNSILIKSKRQQLTTTAFITVMTNKPILSPRSENRLSYLLDRLDRINHSIRSEDAQDAMHDFTHELLQLGILKDELRVRQAQQEPHNVAIFKKGDETMLQDLQSQDAIPILLCAIQRFMGQAAPEFHNSACIALVHFAFQSRERSRIIYENDGFNILVQMMQCYRSTEYVQIICIAALMVIGKNARMYQLLFEHLEALVLHQVVLAMECHQESSKVYVVACSAIGTLFGPGSAAIVHHMNSDDENNLYHRTLDAICYGLILHLDDQVAEGAGHALLCNMVGLDVAEDMIAEVQNAHGGVFAAAAA